MSQTRADKYRVLVFDWDGTLLDSIAAIVECAWASLKELRLPPVSEGSIREAIGLGIRETVEHFVPGCDDELFAQIVRVYRRQWLSTYCHRPVLIRHARRALERLAGSGFLLALATAKNRAGLRHDLEKTGLTEIFVATRTVDDAPSKPHPGMVLDILGQLGAQADGALVVGDTTHDLLMARNAGVAGLAVCSGSQSREDLERLDPVACLESVAELPGWLAGETTKCQVGSASENPSQKREIPESVDAQ